MKCCVVEIYYSIFISLPCILERIKLHLAKLLLIENEYTCVELSDRVKHISLFRQGENYTAEKFNSIGP
jgi:hypothetical protein